MISAMNMIPLGGEEGEELREKHGPTYLEDFLSGDNVCQSKIFKIQLPLRLNYPLLKFPLKLITNHIRSSQFMSLLAFKGQSK